MRFEKILRMLAQALDRRIYPEPEGDETSLTLYVSSYYFLTSSGLGAFSALAFLYLYRAYQRNPEGTLLGLLIATGLMGLLALWSMLIFFFHRCEVTDQGLMVQDYPGVRSAIRWEEVRSVRFSPWRGLGFVGWGGKTVWVSTILEIGLDRFARRVLERIPRENIEPEALRYLKKAARGELPLDSNR